MLVDGSHLLAPVVVILSNAYFIRAAVTEHSPRTHSRQRAVDNRWLLPVFRFALIHPPPPTQIHSFAVGQAQQLLAGGLRLAKRPPSEGQLP